MLDHANAANDAVEDTGDDPLTGQLVLIDVVGQDQRLQNRFGHVFVRKVIGAGPASQNGRVDSCRKARDSIVTDVGKCVDEPAPAVRPWAGEITMDPTRRADYPRWRVGPVFRSRVILGMVRGSRADSG